jgi:hypothetical protein
VLVEISAGRRKLEEGGDLCCLYNDAISNLSYMASNGWLTVNRTNELLIEKDIEGCVRGSILK